MANIVPLRGVRYHPEKAGEMSDLVTPPYDVINTEEQRRYYEKNQYNVIRLEYGEERGTDDENDNRYTRANAFFTYWLSENILVHENKPAIYLYEQEFSVEGRRLTRSGFIAGVGVEEYESGTILPHEETLSKAKRDRLELLRHCHANFSPIFGLYDDATLTVEKIAARYKEQPPVTGFIDENGEAHRLWVVEDPGDLAQIKERFNDMKIYIADGHHRYETALNFHREMREQGDNRFGFTLMTLVNLHDPGLIILPTHRLVRNVSGFSPENLLKNLETSFTVTPVRLPAGGREQALAAELSALEQMMDDSHAFLLYLGNGRLYRLSLLRNWENDTMAKRAPSYSAAWRKLDVAILQCLVLEEHLGIDKSARESGTNLSYTRDTADALNKVDHGEYQAVIFLNPTRVGEVTEVAAAGDRMPQKSTYFYPKLITGLVINDFTV